MKKKLLASSVIATFVLAGCNSSDSNNPQQPLTCPSQEVDSGITLCLTQIPDHHPAGEPIYLAGTPNGWNSGSVTNDPNKPIMMFTENDNGTYSMSLSFSVVGDKHQFKFTRGSWDSVELDSEGYDVANRELVYSGEYEIVELSIGEWKDLADEYLGSRPTLVGNLDTRTFTFPINDGERTVRVWYSDNYDPYRAEPYPVIYAFDGQNLFDTKTASYGMEWEVDETITKLNGEHIVVGLDSPQDYEGQTQDGITRRYIEYSAFDWTHPDKGTIGARGQETVDFLVREIIPFVESNYNVHSETNGRTLLGSSMGGYMGLYTSAYHPDVFSHILALSHATTDGYGGDQLRNYITNQGNTASQLYIDMGDQEVVSVHPPETVKEDMINGQIEMVATLEGIGMQTGINLIERVIEGAAHDEQAWSQRFPALYRELLLKNE